MGWRDIETAPRDGREIILAGFVPDDFDRIITRVTAGFWEEDLEDATDPDWCFMHGGSSGGWMSTDGGFTKEWPALKWKPLPVWDGVCPY